MPDWKERFAALGINFEEKVDAIKLRLRRRAGSFRDVQLIPYRGFGNAECVFVKGRLLKEFKLRSSQETDRLWDNLLATYRRFHTVEVPETKVLVRFGDSVAKVVTDSEGYFSARLATQLLASDRLWHEIELDLADAATKVAVKGEVLVPPKFAEFGVISDIDDTVILSHLQNLPRLAYAVFMQNARARVVVPGVPEFYQALHIGKQKQPANPIFYLSSGPWNLYDLLIEFLELNKIPKGPIFLQDYGFEKGKFLAATHRAHKSEQIQKVLETYPRLPFILIGDSGQHDPEIYLEALQNAPNRIKTIYIRDVTELPRKKKIEELALEATKHGGDLILFQEVRQAMQHAAEKGLIVPA
jgi:phosphatidate phosphatase APP1